MRFPTVVSTTRSPSVGEGSSTHRKDKKFLLVKTVAIKYKCKNALTVRTGRHHSVATTSAVPPGCMTGALAHSGACDAGAFFAHAFFSFWHVFFLSCWQ